MPEYFFSIGLELLQDPNLTLSQARFLEGCSVVRQALAPFAKDTRRQSLKTGSLLSFSSSGHPSSLSTPQTPHAYRKSPFGTVSSSPTDKRLDKIAIESMDMTRTGQKDDPSVNVTAGDKNHVSKGIGSAISGLQTKGSYTPLDHQTTESVWGIVHLYRDSEETPGLYGDSPLSKPPDPWLHGFTKDTIGARNPPPADQDCTTVCVLAVPSYMGPSDFLGFAGEQTWNEVSHFRMIKTARANKYMVLMKFRSGKKAREWQWEWNGKVFNSMEPETCHVVFLKSVEITQSHGTEPDFGTTSGTQTYPTMSDDPFTTTSKTTKPLAPRTPSLVELPTCPVCLERMDETTGLLTILCQHVFHCTCLQKWSGGGCPVCRYTHDDFSSRPGFGKTKSKYKTKKSIGLGAYEYDVDEEPLECETCHAETNLWQCLVCGKIGCGRYDEKHAFSHFEGSGHTFAMDMESKRVWDYAGDGYVHRIIQDGATGEKLVELPGSRRAANTEGTALEDDGDNGFEEEKMEGLALEYTHLLTSQLESQRVYFEEKVGGAADKAAQAATSASQARAAAEKAAEELDELKVKYDDLARDAVPALEKEKVRLERKGDKFESMAREMEKGFKEEKAINTRLMERIQYMSKQIEGLTAAKVDLEEQNRDLTFFISSSEKLKEAGEDVQEGTVTVPDPPTGGGKKKGKGKGKK